MVAVGICYRGADSGPRGIGSSIHALAVSAQTAAQAMKLLSVLLIAFALFARSDPICATPQMPITMSVTECADMDGSKDKHQQPSQGITGGCTTCLFPQIDTPVQPQSSICQSSLFDVPTETPLAEFGGEPLTPPPRPGQRLKDSII